MILLKDLFLIYLIHKKERKNIWHGVILSFCLKLVAIVFIFMIFNGGYIGGPF